MWLKAEFDNTAIYVDATFCLLDVDTVPWSTAHSNVFGVHGSISHNSIVMSLWDISVVLAINELFWNADSLVISM